MSPTIYLAIILGIIIGFIIYKIEINGYDLIGFIGPGAIAGFFVGGIIWFFVGVSNQPDSHQYEVPGRNLAALKDGASMSGSFFLGSGSFGSNMEYYGYENLGDDRFKMVKFPNTSIIIEDIKEGEEPYFVQIREKADISKVIKNDKWMLGPFEHDDFVRWEIHIPKGSILRNTYELDLD